MTTADFCGSTNYIISGTSSPFVEVNLDSGAITVKSTSNDDQLGLTTLKFRGYPKKYPDNFVETTF